MDVLKTLQECSFRGVSFPAVTIDESFDHDLPQHKGVDHDGAFIENTGRNPFSFSLVAPMYAKSVARGQNESWDDLYPTRYLLLRTACLDRSTGEFVHPLYGTFKVKIASWSSSLNADERGGQTVNITVLETRDDGETPAFTPSDSSVMRSTAVSLDASLRVLNPPISVWDTSDDDVSFTDAVSKLVGIIDGTTLQAKQALARIDRTIAKADKVAASINRASDVIVVDAASGVATNLGRLGPGGGRLWTECQVLKSSMRDVRGKLSVDGNKQLSSYIVPRAAMLTSIASKLKATTAELVALNPSLPRNRPAIPATTLIRYYVR